MNTPREKRLFKEFECMKSLLTPHSLISFFTGSLSPIEGTAFLKHQLSPEILEKGFPGFLSPRLFVNKYPDLPPEKYLIAYQCKGLVCSEKNKVEVSDFHVMQVVFGWDYPSVRPTFVWLTPIWHPNFDTPSLCIFGRPFAIGLTLDIVVLEIGRMIQYQNYNIEDPMNKDAADWARENPKLFPVDDRDLLDSRKRIRTSKPGNDEEQLVKILNTADVTLSTGEIVELLPKE